MYQVTAMQNTQILLQRIQRMKSNKQDCSQLARRAAGIVEDIEEQTRNYGRELPEKVRTSIDQIAKSVSLKRVREYCSLEEKKDHARH